MNQSVRITRSSPDLPGRLWFMMFISISLYIGNAVAADGPPATPVSATLVRSDKLVVDISATGSLVANESVMLRPEITGRIDAIKFNEGDRASKGAILVTLDAAEYKARLDVSEANLKLRQISFDRAERLYKQNLTSSQDFDQAAAQLEEARATRKLNEEILHKTVLRAPFDGILGLRLLSPGDYVKDGADIVDIADISSMKVDFEIPETAFRDVRKDQPLSIQVDSYPGETFTGTVYAIAPTLDPASRSLQLRARIPNPDQRLRPGMFARISLHIAEKDKALLIPEEALWPIGDKQFVYKIVDDKVALTEVKVGYRQHGDVEILTGLTDGEQIVTAGQMKIRDGAAVMVLGADTAEK